MISILLPTRKRPNNVIRLLNSLIETETSKNVQVVVRIDNDDEETKSQINNFRKIWKNLDSVILDRPKFLGQSWNDALAKAKNDIYMLCGDDIIFKTKNWDSQIVNVFNSYDDKIVFVFGNDQYNEDRLGTHGFLHKNWVDTVGYFTRNDYYYFNDTWMDNVARIIGRWVYLPDVVTDHLAGLLGRGVIDEALDRMVKGSIPEHKKFPDEKNLRLKDAKKLLEFIHDFK